MSEKEISKEESLELELFNQIIQDPVGKKVLSLIIENKNTKEILGELLGEEEKL